MKDALMSLHEGGRFRVQEVYTPPFILDAVRAAFGGQIGLDPCAATDSSMWFAETNWHLPYEVAELQEALEAAPRGQTAELKRRIKAFTHAGSLTREWPSVPTFMNPHFDTLAPWLARFAAMTVPAVVLCPVRTHRKWWVRGAVGAECVLLAPFAFVGNKSTFPAPLCLLSRNCRIPYLGKAETGRASFGVSE